MSSTPHPHLVGVFWALIYPEGRIMRCAELRFAQAAYRRLTWLRMACDKSAISPRRGQGSRTHR